MSVRRILTRILLPAAVMGGGMTTAAIYGPWTDIKFQSSSVFSRVFQLMDPETAHNWAVWAAENNLLPKDDRQDPVVLHTHLLGKIYPNPIGLAAGFDKNAQCMKSMKEMGFGFVEIGSVTPLPQSGNPKPRVFRIPEKKAAINRYGFNSDGVDAVAVRLDAFRKRYPNVLMGVNLGVNKANALDWKAAARDYELGMRQLAVYADYVVINISSPNTMGLRALQSRKQFASLMQRVKRARDDMNWKEKIRPPIFVKISPDLTKEDREDIARVASDGGFDGLIVSNTTIARPGVEGATVASEVGGLSGAPLFTASTELLREMYRLTNGSVPIIGCGGVANGYQAYQKIRAGATLVQLYTVMTYDGPAILPKIKSELEGCLRRDKFQGAWEAVGADHKRR